MLPHAAMAPKVGTQQERELKRRYANRMPKNQISESQESDAKNCSMRILGKACVPDTFDRAEDIRDAAGVVLPAGL